MSRKESQLGCAEASTGDEQSVPDSAHRPGWSQGRGDGLGPPRDPYLRAIYEVGQLKDLTPTERLGLLALWKFLGSDRKPVGPTLLAYWLGIHRSHAKTVLWRLQKKGYIGSTGTAGRGVQPLATRWITGKSQLPNLKKRSPQHNRAERGPEHNRAAVKSTRERGPQHTADQEGDKTALGRSAPSAMTEAGVEESTENSGTGELFNIAEHMARGVDDA